MDSDSDYDYDLEDAAYESDDTDDSNKEEPIPKNVFEYLNENQVLEYMTNIIKDVNKVTQIPEKMAGILLSQLHWNKNDLLERIYDEDQDKFFADFNVVNPFKQIDENIPCKSSKYQDCEICYVTYSAANLLGLDCGHKYCRTCWDGYLSAKILDEGMGKTLSCPTHDCSIFIDHETCSNLLKNSRTKKLYQKLIINSFIECNPCLHRCPNSKCNNVIKAQFMAINIRTRTLTCSCGTTFCCTCSQNKHVPINCEYLKKWNTKLNFDSGTSNWIAENTKDCPRCKTPIQKNGGCNTMTCKNKNCSLRFCWLCMKSIAMHGDCLSTEEATNKNRPVSDKRVQLQRFLFNFNRYSDHKRSFELEQDVLRSSLKTKRAKLQNDGYSWSELQCLEDTLNVLLDCRQTLSYTYAFAYYLCPNNEFFIFQGNQNNLHKTVENLSEYLESGMDSDNYATMKLKLNSMRQYCDDRRVCLESHVYEGYENRSWSFNPDL